MDKVELIEKLKSFQEACASNGRALDKIFLEEAYPGDDSTSFILGVKASWMDPMACFPIIDYLTDKLFESTDVETRKRIFFVKVLDNDDQIHCFQQVALTENLVTSV